LNLAGVGFFARLNRMTDSKIFNAIKNIRVDSNVRRHILDWESWNSWWHRYWTWRSWKTEFPQNWSDDKIINTINGIISDSNSRKVIQWTNRIQIFWTKDWIDLKIIVDVSLNKVVTWFPLNTPKNP